MRRKVTKLLPRRGPHASGPDGYLLECGHKWLGYARVKSAAVGIEVIHPKTAQCTECDVQEPEGYFDEP